MNDIIINQFPGEEHNLLSFDEVEGDTHNLYQQKFLNSIDQGSIPPHISKVKKGAPLMLLRNVKICLCNGIRLLCRGLFKKMLDVEILTGNNAGKSAFLPIIKLKTNVSSRPFVLSRKQFPVRLSFAITIGDFTKNIVFKDILLSQSYQCFFYITLHLYIYVIMLLITIKINNK